MTVGGVGEECNETHLKSEEENRRLGEHSEQGR